MIIKKFMAAGIVAIMLQGVAPAQAQQVVNKGPTTGDIISYMLLGGIVTATVWYLWPVAATAEVAAGAGATGATGMAGGAAAAPLVADAAMVGGAGAGAAGAGAGAAVAAPVAVAAALP